MPKQARVLSDKDIRKVLKFIATQRHSVRNRAMLMTMYLAGLRVSECAALTYGHVIDSDGQIVEQFNLQADQTKGSSARRVFVGFRLRKELAAYVKQFPPPCADHALFYSQKNAHRGFSANTLCQHFHRLFAECGLAGASSHSPRRTFITNLANRGVSVRILQSLAGHRNMSTTQLYIDVNDGQQQAAVDLL